MKNKLACAAVVLNKRKDYKSLLNGIRDYLSAKEVDIIEISLPYTDYNSGHKFHQDKLDNIDFVISLGGDGTLLFTARLFYNINIPVIAVNLGSFGFITEICRDEIYDSLDSLFDNSYEIEKRSMLDVSVTRDNKVIERFFPLNETVIGRKEISRLVSLKTKVNDEYLCTYKADGLIISTPTGSTGYSLSANGPILMPSLQNFIINPICPHSLASRPFIVSENDKVTITVEGEGILPILTIDVQESMDLKYGDIVSVKKAENELNLILSKKRTFFQVLREKLGWVDS